MVKFKEYDIFYLTSDLIQYGLKKGQRGTVLMAIRTNPQSYEVEFMDNDGVTIAQIHLFEEYMDSANITDNFKK